MRKNKKRLQMQTKTDEQRLRQLLDESVAFGLFKRVGTDAEGEPLYTMSPNAEARAEVLRKIINSKPPADD